MAFVTHAKCAESWLRHQQRLKAAVREPEAGCRCLQHFSIERQGHVRVRWYHECRVSGFCDVPSTRVKLRNPYRDSTVTEFRTRGGVLSTVILHGSSTRGGQPR